MKRHIWTDTERDILRALYPNFSAAECAAAIGCDEISVWGKAKRMGLRKSGEWIAQRARERSLEPNHGSHQTRFTKGGTSWNKGKKLPGHGGLHTRFKNGQRPHTWRPIGAEAIRDGVLWRKVSDTPGRHSRFDWEAVHRIVWQQQHGPLQRGDVVAFKPGMHTTVADEITIDRLELIDRRTLQARNRISHLPPEVQDTIRTLNKLKRAIREHAKDAS